MVIAVALDVSPASYARSDALVEVFVQLCLLWFGSVVCCRAMCWQTQRPISALVFGIVGATVLLLGLFVTVADEVCGDSGTPFCTAVGASN
jgi:hypothetical protein|eukprot:COSAG02_NODE_2984_length_7618_cov_6.217981_2_plen_91_part_00